MKDIVIQNDQLLFRRTRKEDLDYVIQAEGHPENSDFVTQWPLEYHEKAMNDPNYLHLIIEPGEGSHSIGYCIIAGLQDRNKSIELLRLVITEKGKGHGRQTLKLVKNLAFEECKGHRLWLDVRDHNTRAFQLYQSEGFVNEGKLRECVLKNNRFESIYIMSILEGEYHRIK